MNPEELVRRDNVGRTTLAALVSRAEESLPPVTVDFEAPDFLEAVDAIIETLVERAQRIVVARFQDHTRSIEVARAEGLSRERVRQIEEKFVARVTAAVRRHRLLGDDILEDGLVEFDELSSGTRDPQYSEGFYVAVARTVLIEGDSYVDTERFYGGQLQILADEIRNDDDFILAKLAATRVLELARQTAPALIELGPEELWRRLHAELHATETAGRLVGRKPQVGRIIRALLRSAAGPISVAVLVNQLRFVLAAYGEVSYFDEVRLRNKLFAMEGVHLSDQQTASLAVHEPGMAANWADLFVSDVLAAGKPYSLVRFLDEHEDCPFDAFGMASLLRSDRRVVRVARRLYAPAEYDAEGSLRIAELIQEALESSNTPMTRRELLAFVQSTRDVICTQIENYFQRVPGLVKYTRDVVGLRPLNRAVMLQMLEREPCVVSLLRHRSKDRLVPIETLWLLSDEGPELTADEEHAILKSGRKWKTTTVSAGHGGLFFSVKEDA